MKFIKILLLGLIPFIALSGCKELGVGGTPLAACEISPVFRSGSYGCLEFSGTDQGTLDQMNTGACATLGTVVPGCAAATLGTCTVVTGVYTQTYYYYTSDGVSLSTAQMICSMSGGTWH